MEKLWRTHIHLILSPSYPRCFEKEMVLSLKVNATVVRRLLKLKVFWNLNNSTSVNASIKFPEGIMVSAKGNQVTMLLNVQFLCSVLNMKGLLFIEFFVR